MMPLGNCWLGKEVTLSLSWASWHSLSPSRCLTPTSGLQTLAHFLPEDSTLKFRTLCSLSAICYPILTQSLAVLGDLAPLLVSTDRTLDPVLLREHEVGLGRLQLPLVGGQPHPAGPGVLLAGGNNDIIMPTKLNILYS